MAFFGDIQKIQLTSTLSSNSPAAEEDVKAVKKRLNDEGYYDEPSYGFTPYPDQGLFDGIKNFQRDNGLTVDGVMNPDGETVMALNEISSPTSDEAPPLPPIPKRKPETISPSKKGNALLDFIGQLESSDNYNAIYGGGEKPLTKMTVREVQKLQQKMVDEGRESSAVGRYQFLRGTLKETVAKLGIDKNTVFDEKLQDHLARSRMELQRV